MSREEVCKIGEVLDRLSLHRVAGRQDRKVSVVDESVEIDSFRRPPISDQLSHVEAGEVDVVVEESGEKAPVAEVPKLAANGQSVDGLVDHLVDRIDLDVDRVHDSQDVQTHAGEVPFPVPRFQRLRFDWLAADQTEFPAATVSEAIVELGSVVAPQHSSAAARSAPD